MSEEAQNERSPDPSPQVAPEEAAPGTEVQPVTPSPDVQTADTPTPPEQEPNQQVPATE